VHIQDQAVCTTEGDFTCTVGSKHPLIKRACGSTLPWAAFNFSLCFRRPRSKKHPASVFYCTNYKFSTLRFSKFRAVQKKSDAKFIGGAAAKNLFAWGSRKLTSRSVHTFMQQNCAKISYN